MNTNTNEGINVEIFLQFNEALSDQTDRDNMLREIKGDVPNE